ncbi:unnamed protein product, partial [Dibothriocephalus latus]
MTVDKKFKISPPPARKSDDRLKRKKGFGFKFFGRKKNNTTSTESSATDDEASTSRSAIPSGSEEAPWSGQLDAHFPETLQAVRKSLQNLTAEVHNDSRRLTCLIGKSLSRTSDRTVRNSSHFLPSTEELREIKHSIELLVDEVSCENKHIKAVIREALKDPSRCAPPHISIKSATDPSKCSSEPPSVAATPTTVTAADDDDEEEDPPSLHSFLMDSSIVSSNVDNSCRNA